MIATGGDTGGNLVGGDTGGNLIGGDTGGNRRWAHAPGPSVSRSMGGSPAQPSR